jgi:hypothetical protein
MHSGEQVLNLVVRVDFNFGFGECGSTLYQLPETVFAGRPPVEYFSRYSYIACPN